MESSELSDFGWGIAGVEVWVNDGPPNDAGLHPFVHAARHELGHRARNYCVEV